MASRFWVGGTGTWDASDTTHWAASTGGAGGQSVPGSSDTVTLDGSSGGGTVTVNTTVTVISITMGAFTGTLDFAPNDNNVTLSGNFSGTGAGVRTLNMGDGTWTLTGATSIWDIGTSTNMTLNANGSTILFNTAGAKGGNNFSTLTYNNLTIAYAAHTGRAFACTGSPTFNNVTITNLGMWVLPGSATFTITGTFSYNGTAINQGSLSTGGSTTAVTFSVANAAVLNWLFVASVTKAGAGSITANNSFDGGTNTGVTFTNPAIKSTYNLGAL